MAELKVEVNKIIKGPCKGCRVLTPPDREVHWGRSRNEMDLREEFPWYVSPDPVQVQVPVPANDRIRYQDKLIPANYIFLGNTVDRCLLDFCTLQEHLTFNERYPLPSQAVSMLEQQKHKQSAQRKDVMLIPPEPDGIDMYYSGFAVNAKLELLYRQLFRHKGATTKNYSPQRLCTFFYEKGLDEKMQSDPEKYGELFVGAFQMEDYIVFEQLTGISFFVEACAALSQIPEGTGRTACKEVLLDNLETFLISPFLLSRIALMRQFLADALPRVQTASLQYLPEGMELKAVQKQIAQNALDQLLRSWLPQQALPLPCTAKADSVKRCRAQLQTYIQDLKEPIDLAEYKESPIYGPVAFCNPRHAGVAALLDDLQFYNDASPEAMPRRTPKEWLLFSELYQQAEARQKIRWAEQRAEWKRREKLLRKQTKQQEIT